MSRSTEASCEATRLPVGVNLVSVVSRKDSRGDLIAFEEHLPVAFSPVRTFVIRNVPFGQVRAGHALSCHEFLWLVTGSCTATLHDGQTRSTIRLRAGGRALAVVPGVWLELADFGDDTVLLVLASEPYSRTQRFSKPQPALIEAHTQTP